MCQTCDVFPRWYVRVGRDVRGPVDDATVAHWIAQGMVRADVCAEGQNVWTPIGATHFGAHVSQRRSRQFFGGIGAAVAAVVLTAGGCALRVCNAAVDVKKERLQETLPRIDSEGVLQRDDGKKIGLCAPGRHGGYFAWPCGDETVAPNGTRVHVYKAEVQGTDAKCRYAVIGGSHDRFVGDGDCGWFRPDSR